jgi:hypothetical protein
LMTSEGLALRRSNLANDSTAVGLLANEGAKFGSILPVPQLARMLRAVAASSSKAVEAPTERANVPKRMRPATSWG